MVKVRFTFKDNTTKVSNFPNATLRDIKGGARNINKNIKNVQLIRKKPISRRPTYNPYAGWF